MWHYVLSRIWKNLQRGIEKLTGIRDLKNCSNQGEVRKFSFSGREKGGGSLPQEGGGQKIFIFKEGPPLWGKVIFQGGPYPCAYYELVNLFHQVVRNSQWQRLLCLQCLLSFTTDRSSKSQVPNFIPLVSKVYLIDAKLYQAFVV